MSDIQAGNATLVAVSAKQVLFETWLARTTHTRKQKSALRKVFDGVQYLDHAFGQGSWEGRVGSAARSGTLEIASCKKCALAMATEGDFFDAMKAQGLIWNDCQARGFASSRRVNYYTLNWAWRVVMTWRSAGVAFAT